MSKNNNITKSNAFNGQNKTRQLIIDEFKKCLSMDHLPWEKGWQTYTHHNPTSGTRYKGVNAFVLSMICQARKYDDPRWMTFKQIQNNDKLHLKKGSKGVPVEFWSGYDKKEKKKLTIEEANKLLLDKDRRDDVMYISHTYTVFNGSCVEGLEPWYEKDNENYYNHEEHPESALAMNVFNDYLQNEGIGIEYYGDRSYYNMVMIRLLCLTGRFLIPLKDSLVHRHMK